MWLWISYESLIFKCNNLSFCLLSLFSVSVILSTGSEWITNIKRVVTETSMGHQYMEYKQVALLLKIISLSNFMPGVCVELLWSPDTSLGVPFNYVTYLFKFFEKDFCWTRRNSRLSISWQLVQFGIPVLCGKCQANSTKHKSQVYRMKRRSRSVAGTVPRWLWHWRQRCDVGMRVERQAPKQMPDFENRHAESWVSTKLFLGARPGVPSCCHYVGSVWRHCLITCLSLVNCKCLHACTFLAHSHFSK